MIRICRNCHREYDGDPGSTLCPTCVREQRSTTIRDRICRTCGTTFPGGPRAWFCPVCRAERRREQDRRHKKQGAARPLGSTDLCIVCGSEYTVNSGGQRYCPACAPAAVAAIDRAQGIQWNKANTTPEARRELRRDHAAQLVCRVCGKPFIPRSAAETCSPECSAQLRRQYGQAFEAQHREERNAYHRKKRQAKLADMTPEELEAHRAKVNQRARENYKKRKDRKNGQ